MFDEFVEHAGSPPAGGLHGVPAAHSLATPVQYQGFEPSPFIDSLDAPKDPAVAAPSESPIFDLGYVQFPMPAPLVTMAVSSDIVALGLSNNTVVLILLAPGAKEEPITTIPIPRKPSEFSIYKLFFDPSGRHLLISSLQGENWYLAKGWTKPRPLKGFKFVIESVAWHTRALLSSQNSAGTSSHEILIGARNGTVYEALLHSEDDIFRGQERYLQSVFALPERQPVTGLSFSLYPVQGQTKALVVVTTPTRIYQFVGSPDVNRKGEERDGRMFLSLFAAYRDKHLQITDMPGELEHSELHLFTALQDASTPVLPTTLAWMSAPGIYHGSLNFTATSESLIAGASLLTYPPSYGPPISLLLTEFHFVLLYADRVLALSTLDERVAYEEILPLKPGEVPRALVADPVKKTYWVYTDQTIFELRKENEARDVWRAYLDKEQFDLALKHAKTATHRDTVLIAQADSLFASGKFYPAAQSYAASSAPFEDVSLKFLSAGERDALRAYLVGRLERTKKTDATQRTLLATWLVEMYLAKCDALDDLVAAQGVAQDVENLRAERALVDEDLRACLETYRASLDRTTTYELIQAHGRTDIFLHFAGLVGDVEKVLEHHVMDEQWAQAIEVIARQPESEEALELYYRFAPVLLRNAPAQTVDAWLRQPSLDPVRLVPALLQVQHAPSTSTTESDPAVRYLTHAIFERKSTEASLHTLLLTLHASASDPARLLRFLSTAPDDPIRHTPCFDLDYALRLCAAQGSKGAAACAVIYARMGLHADAVDAALRAGDVELAKVHAEKPTDAQERKRLWLQVAKYVVQEQKDVKAAMKLIADAGASAGAGTEGGGDEGVLGVEDVLPFFPDFVLIDDFKDEICGALEAHAARLQALRTRLDEAAVAAEAVKKDVGRLRERFVTIDASERCAVCTRGVLLRQFFVFPCMHVLHTDCLIGVAKEYMPQATLRRLVALQDTLIQAQRTALASGAGPITPGIGLPPTSATRPPTVPAPARTLLSSNLANLNPLALQPASLGRGLRTAGDKLRDLVVPDALAALVAHPLIGVGIGGGSAVGKKDAKGQEEVEKARKELEELLASTCPLCESVVVGLDRGFVGEDEDESSWAV